jgi:hypothetical protein
MVDAPISSTRITIGTFRVVAALVAVALMVLAILARPAVRIAATFVIHASVVVVAVLTVAALHRSTAVV